MGLPILFILGIFLNIAHSREMQDSESRDLVLDQNVTGIVGEDVYLHCMYTGQSKILFSSWNRLDSSNRARKMAGYKFGNHPLNKENFGIPASPTNLTVKISITGLKVEGEYTCVFNSDEDETKGTMFLSVIARPDVDITVKKEVVNGTLHQAVTCAATNAKPKASIRWRISSVPPRDDIFSVNIMNVVHPNGTTSSISVLRFPLILNNESTVTCVVEHSAFTEPKEANIEVDTFVSPLLTMETILVQEGEEDFQEVICTAAGGRPHPNITWILPEPKNTPSFERNITKPDKVTSSYRFPSELYEGKNITCIFEYMLLPFMSTRTVTLPTYYLSLLKLEDRSLTTNNENETSLAFQMEEKNIRIRMEIVGDLPSYKISCLKDSHPLPEDVSVIGSDLFIRGPLQLHHAGNYVCQASYQKHLATLEFKVEAKPKVLLPVFFPPNISLNLKEGSDHLYIECLALNASPAANVSWIVPHELNGTIRSDVTTRNGSHSVRSVLTLPLCMPSEYTIECVVEHPLLNGKMQQQVSLPVCATPNITLHSSIEWESDTAYAGLVCSVESQRPPLTISWSTENCDIDIGSELVMSQSESQKSHMVISESVAHIPIYVFGGCTVTCVVEQPGLEKPEKKSIDLPSLGLSGSRLFVREQLYPPLWYAMCECSGDSVKPNISWILPADDTIVQPTVQSTYNGINVQVNSTFEFQLKQYEGKDLICVIQNKHGKDERKIHVPKYSISSIEVLNKTTLYRRTPWHHEHRVTLQENLSYQKILLRAHGNAPSYKTECYRENGLVVHTVGMALVFTEPVSELDAGLYICHVSYHHHTASVSIRVEVSSEKTQHLIFVTTCFSSAAAITLILTVVLCVLCKPSGKSHPSNKKNRRERESLAALMQDPRSPEKTVLPYGTGPDYAELLHYSIVLDVKSTV
ncbi:uncharacterized protein si:ch211-149e23.4 [Triplophysa dalaica]|uniref:uncharacterized protein si:ch211-149e23.4 n=1 Tax=Triplophysa dalaica TaxID=1582913 RepID=UPI0024DF738C|nr:uncharacterized protein si:ch211-149e23.4 [Triplophysa dalaica]